MGLSRTEKHKKNRNQGKKRKKKKLYIKFSKSFSCNIINSVMYFILYFLHINRYFNC